MGKKVLFLGGNNGCGKSTCVEILCKELGIAVIRFTEDIDTTKLYAGENDSKSIFLLFNCLSKRSYSSFSMLFLENDYEAKVWVLSVINVLVVFIKNIISYPV